MHMQMGVHEEELLWLDERVRLLKVKLYTVPNVVPGERTDSSVHLMVREDCPLSSGNGQSGGDVRAQQD